MSFTSPADALRIVAAALVLATAACTNSTGPEEVPEGAAFVYSESSSLSVVSFSSTARVGVPFELTVNTYGLDGCWVRARTDVSTRRGETTVTPFNRSSASSGSGCAQVIARIPHHVTLTIATAGEHRLLIRGFDLARRTPTVVNSSITVLP